MEKTTNNGSNKGNKEVIVAAGAEGKQAEVIAATPAATTVAAPVVEAAAPQAEVIQSAAPAAVSKASIANAIFKKMFAMPQVPARKDMIKAAMAEAKLTEKGAATYLQNYKAKHGLVKKAAATA